MTALNILVTSAGRRGQLVQEFQRTLASYGGGKVVAADASTMAAAAYLSDSWEQVPRVDSPNYVDALLGLCHRHAIGLVVPTIDTELLPLSQARARFESIGTTVAVSGPGTIAISRDKRITNSWLLENDFPAPRQWAVRDDPLPADIPLPVMVKPAQGSRSVGATTVETVDALNTAWTLPDTVVEELLTGQEFTVSVYVTRAGRCLSTVPRERVEVRDGEVSKAITRRLPALEALAARIAEELPDAWGPLNIQVMGDPDSQEFRVIEINARFGGGDPLAWRAGADAPHWLVEEAAGREPSATEWTEGLAMLRFDQAVYLSKNGSVAAVD